ncbi:hypothetical protein HMPREF3213_00100 [Heyndrickxia coagulans]|uniref:Uncharacterized protein n=1 Tax=Heyndrickxia coagulans TaxID=1398 RepID=A0A133L3E5_HEYCO|nr:hypothetical protein HMPREF3213_00100 [Heyndrickxia coagulans]
MPAVNRIYSSHSIGKSLLGAASGKPHIYNDKDIPILKAQVLNFQY